MLSGCSNRLETDDDDENDDDDDDADDADAMRMQRLTPHPRKPPPLPAEHVDARVRSFIVVAQE